MSAPLREAARALLDERFNEGYLWPEGALRSVADWLDTPRFADMSSDGEVQHDLRLLADRLEALRAALDKPPEPPSARERGV